MIATDLMILPAETMTDIQDKQDGKVLVIDDELGPRESLRFLLKPTYEVHCADCVDRGVELLKRISPDIIIMDIKMPGKTGIDGLREIRAVDPAVSVVMLTGFATVETAQEAIRLGANDYVKKPFNTSEMREIVRKYVEHTSITRKKARAERTLDDLNRKLQSELREKERLASLGQASSEFVHDIRNPLSVIQGYCQLLAEDLAHVSADSERSKETLEYLSRIESSVNRCREMSDIWRTLGRNDPARMAKCRVVDLLEEAVDHSEAVAKETGSVIVLEKGGPECSVMADRVQLFRAFQNLIGNAVQALPGNGGRVRISWTLRDGNVCVCITDNGCGIPEENLDSLFGPYTTTKASSGGMGLGLFISKKVVESHGGTVALANNSGSGATATVTLPAAD